MGYKKPETEVEKALKMGAAYDKYEDVRKNAPKYNFSEINAKFMVKSKGPPKKDENLPDRSVELLHIANSEIQNPLNDGIFCLNKLEIVHIQKAKGEEIEESEFENRVLYPI